MSRSPSAVRPQWAGVLRGPSAAHRIRSCGAGLRRSCGTAVQPPDLPEIPTSLMRGLGSLKWIIPVIRLIQIFSTKPCFGVPWRGTIEIRTEGWDDWNGLIHADDTSSSSDRMHQDTPTNSQHWSDWYQPDRTDHPDRDLR